MIVFIEFNLDFKSDFLHAASLCLLAINNTFSVMQVVELFQRYHSSAISAPFYTLVQNQN